MILGVTGKIASGKTEIMKILQNMGFCCIYADEVVHSIYKRGGEGTTKIADVFGDKFIKSDGSVDRKKLRDVVFNNKKKLLLLNKTIHPLVYKEVKYTLNTKLNKCKDIAIEAVYFDKDFLGDFVQKIIVINRQEKDIIECLMNERGFDIELAKKAIKLYSSPMKIDYTIDNKGTLRDLNKDVLKILSNI